MNSNKSTLRFSGHDTFNCKEQWILKGLQLIENELIHQYSKKQMLFQS